MADVTIRFRGDSSSAVRAAGQTEASLARVSNTSHRLGRALRVGTVTAGIAVVTALGKALSAAGNFEASLNTLQAVSGATGRQMKAVSRLAKALGADLTLPGTSAKDAADAMTELAKGGLTVRDSMNAARGVLQLSAAAQIENAAAAEIVADALNAFNLRGEEAVRVADLLAASANATTAEIGDMALALKQSSAVAAQLNIPIEDTITALSELANAGIKGSDAGTSLRTMLLRLNPATAKSAEVMKKLGINAFDQQGQLKPLPAIIADYRKGLAGLTDQQRLAALQTIFGTDAIRAANIILGKSPAEFEKLRKAVSRQGAAADLAAAKMKGFRGALEGLKSAAETLAISIGEPLLKAATKAVTKLSQLVGFLDKVASAKGTRLKFEILMEGLGDAATVSRAFAADLAFRLEEQLGQVDWERAARVAIDALAAALQRTAELGKAITDMVSRALDQVDWGSFGFKIGPLFVAAWISAIATLVDPGFWLGHWQEMLAVALAVLPWGRVALIGRKIVEVLAGPLIRLLGPLAGRAMSAAVDLVLRIAERLGPRLGALFLAAVVAAEQALARLPGRVAAILTRVVEAIGKKLGGLKGFLAKVIAWDALIRAAEQAVNAVIDKIKEAAGRIRGLLPSWKTAAVALGLAVVNGVTLGMASFVAGVVERIREAAQAVKGFAGTFFAYAFSLGSSIASGIISGIGDLAGRLGSKIADGAKGAVGIAKGVLGIGSPSKLAASEFGKPIADGILLGYLNGTRDLPQKISDRLRNALDRAKTTVDARRTALRTAFDRLASDALRAFDARTDKLVSNLEKKLDATKRAIDDALQADLAAVERRRGALTPAEAELAGLLSGREAAERARAIAEAQAALAEAQTADDPAEILRAQRELDDALFEETRFQLEQRANLERQAADAEAEQQTSRLEAAAERRRLAAEEEFEARRLELEAQRELERRHLEDFLAQQAEFLEKHPEQWRKVYNRIVKIFGDEFGPNFKTAGENLGKAFARGLREARDEVAAAARALAAETERYLKLGSPAKAGPLASLDRWFDPFADTLLQGLDSTAIQRTLAAAVRAPTLAPGLQAAAGAMGGGAGVTVLVTGNTLLADERETARQLALLVDPHLRQLTGYTFPR